MREYATMTRDYATMTRSGLVWALQQRRLGVRHAIGLGDVGLDDEQRLEKMHEELIARDEVIKIRERMLQLEHEERAALVAKIDVLKASIENKPADALTHE